MNQPPLGCSIDDLDTPALCIDLDKLEANIARMADLCRRHGVAWRPHAKGHKSPEIARLQLAAGAIGVTCAKLGEAEVMADAGVRDLLIANQIVGRQKVARLVDLRRRADPIVAVDHRAQVDPISAAMNAAGLSLRLLVEVDIGLARAGTPPGEKTVELARYIAQQPGVSLAGIMGYEGHLLTIEDQAEKGQRIHAALDTLIETRRAIEAAGLPCPIVSAGGTGSYAFTIAHPGLTEIQAGGLIFMDAFYRHVCRVTEFDDALCVMTTVVSRPAAERAVVDAGRKTLHGDLHPPLVAGREDIAVTRLSAEHGELRLAPSAQGLAIGDRLRLIPGYGDFTCVLHDEFYALRGDRLAAIWPLTARGKIR